MKNKAELNEMQDEARRALADPQLSASERATAVLRLCEVDYWRARMALRALPEAVRCRILEGRAGARGYLSLEIDLYTGHWLAARSLDLGLSPAILEAIRKIGYSPERTASLPPGCSIYRDPETVPPAEKWPELPVKPPRRGAAARRLRRGDVVRLKGRLFSGFNGRGLVVEDMLRDHDSVRFVRLNADKNAPPSLALRHQVSLVGEIPPEAGTTCESPTARVGGEEVLAAWRRRISDLDGSSNLGEHCAHER